MLYSYDSDSESFNKIYTSAFYTGTYFCQTKMQPEDYTVTETDKVTTSSTPTKEGRPIYEFSFVNQKQMFAFVSYLKQQQDEHSWNT
tara:strand:- start:4856 stop:5116 length:261 start_codon:yes stop_codon:yes gene_type:complete